MSTNVTFDGTVYAIPASGEINWPALSSYLIALAGAGVAKQMKQAVRKALTSPVTVSATTDFAVATNLTSPGAVAVNLPAGVAGQIFVIVDDKGDAGTNNITITRNGSDTIAGSTTLVLDHNRQAVMLGYSSADTDWKVLYKTTPAGTIVNADIASAAALAYSKLNLSASIATADLASGLLVPVTKGGTGQTTIAAALAAISPLTTKGDVLTFDTVNNRLPVGTDTQFLTADSSQVTGLKWAAGTSSTLNANLVDIGNASNARTATNTVLLGDIKAATLSQTTTVTIATPGVFTSNSHGMTTGDKFYLTTSGALPTGLSASTSYYAQVLSSNTFSAATTRTNAAGGTVIATTGSQSGTHTLFTGGLLLSPGEEVSNKPAALTGSATLTNWASLTLAPGTWNITAIACNSSSNVGAGGTYIIIAIATSSGNSVAGTTDGYDYVRGAFNATSGYGGACVPCKRVTIAATTNYYLNGKTDHTAASDIVCSMTATRVV